MPTLLLLLLSCAARELRVAWRQVAPPVAPYIAAPSTYVYEEAMRVRLSPNASVRVLEERWGSPRAEGERLVWEVETVERTEAGPRLVEHARMFASAEGLGVLGRGQGEDYTPYPSPRLLLPADPHDGARWDSTWEDQGRRLQRSCGLAAFGGCADGWLSVCTTHVDGAPQLRFSQAWCPGVGPVGYQVEPLERGSVWLGTRTTAATRDGQALPAF